MNGNDNMLTCSLNHLTVASAAVQPRRLASLIFMLLLVIGSLQAGSAVSADDVIDLDKVGNQDRGNKIIALLNPHLNRTVRLQFTVKYYGGVANIYLDSEREGMHNEPHNVVLMLPDGGKTKNGMDTWDAFRDIYSKSQNIKTKDEFRKYLMGRRIEATGTLLGSAPSSERQDTAPFRIIITDPKQLKVLQKTMK